MNPLRRLTVLLRNGALWTVLLIGVLFTLLGALAFLVAAFFIWMSSLTSPAAAAAITGGTLIILAIVAGLIGGTILSRMRARQPSFVGSLGGTLGLAARVIAMAVRSDPRKALILSIVAGALAEYMTSERKK
jgi:hypothetical protein